NAIRAQSRSFRAVAAWGNIPTMLDDVRQQGASLLVTADYFRVYGIDSPLIGRYFLPDLLTPMWSRPGNCVNLHGKVYRARRRRWLVSGFYAAVFTFWTVVWHRHASLSRSNGSYPLGKKLWTP